MPCYYRGKYNADIAQMMEGPGEIVRKFPRLRCFLVLLLLSIAGRSIRLAS